MPASLKDKLCVYDVGCYWGHCASGVFFLGHLFPDWSLSLRWFQWICLRSQRHQSHRLLYLLLRRWLPLQTSIQQDFRI